MGAELAKAYPAAQAVFSEVDEALGQKLSHLMWEGPEADLTLTENAQPALMAVSMAAMRVLVGKLVKIPAGRNITACPLDWSAIISPRKFYGI